MDRGGGGDVDSDYSYLKNSNIIAYIYTKTVILVIVGVVDHFHITGRNETTCWKDGEADRF